MYLKKAILVHWGNIPNIELEFGPINLFSGGNGSGKTTAADAIQTLMTAAHENLFNYNPGQDETTQKGRGGKQVRTLASYVLGCDDGSYSRPHPTDGYIAGVFYPTQGEVAEPFTALMCMRAHLDEAGKQKQARLDTVHFIILPGEALNLGHLIREYKDGKHVVAINHIAELLIKEFGRKSVEQYDKKGAYLRRLYGIVRGKKDSLFDREAKHAARTLSNFMAYKPVKSINEFVANEILKPKDLGDAIKSVSELMKTIHHMEADTKAILQSLDTLQASQTTATSYITRWQERCVLNLTEALRKQQSNQKNYLAAKAQQNQTQASISENAERTTVCEQRRQQTHTDMVALEAQRQGVAALKTKDELELRIKNAQYALGQKAVPLIEQDQQLIKNLEATKDFTHLINQNSLGVAVPRVDAKLCKNLAKQAMSVEHLNVQALVSADWIDNQSLEAKLDTLLATDTAQQQWAAHLKEGSSQNPSVRDEVNSQLQLSGKKLDEQRQKLRVKHKEVQLLEAKKVAYPPYVEAALNAIKKSCPQAAPQVLCDFIEITDEHWQMAIEGYLGGARFSILIEPEFEAQAIAIVRSMPDKRNRARVIQGHKAQKDAKRLNLPTGSVIEVMQFNHKIAEYYVKASYGTVMCVDDAQTLRTTARGITPEGLGSGNYSMWRCDLNDADLVFGQGARVRALAAKKNEAQVLEASILELTQMHQTFKAAFEAIEKIAPVHCVRPIQEMLGLHRDIQNAETQLSQLDLSDYSTLEGQLEALTTAYKTLETEHRTLVEDAGKLKEQQRQQTRKVKELADAGDVLTQAVDDTEAAVNNITVWAPEFDIEQALHQAEQQAASAGQGFNFEEQANTLTTALDKYERELYQSLVTHNQHCQAHDGIVLNNQMHDRHSGEFCAGIVKLNEQITLIHNRLKNNVLVDKYEKLEQLKTHFNTAFVSNLCHIIYQAIDEGKQALEELNTELELHRFGADREKFYFDTDWVPEFREYYQFLKEVNATPDLGDGTNLFTADLSPKSCKVRDNLLSMLLDPDEYIALRELNRISDYRNYRHYEIYKEPEGKAPIALSQYGTGSGGQLETPAYIIRSAAVTSAFRFNEGKAHLRMVLVDEAFSKMDETRSREVIGYLTERLGLQLIFIMPTSKSGPFMDLISNQFVYSKCPTAEPVGELKTRVLVDRKQCNQEKIKSLWANHRKTVRHQGLLDFMEAL